MAGNWKIDIQGCASSTDCVSVNVDPIEIEMHDVTQSNDTTWKTFTSGQPRFGEARFTFRVSDAALNKDLTTWIDEVRQGKNIRKMVTITITKKNKSDVGRSYNIVEAFPISFSGGDFTTGAESNLAELRVQPTKVELG